MPLILNINTAFETASVNLSSGDEIKFELQSSSQKDHASFLEPAIKEICTGAKISFNSIDAIAVINGPGSYTGLRVGLSSAKALCYASKKPLVLLNTLDVMAFALKLQSPVSHQNVFYCPMIDARRMEVFTALYDQNLHLVKNYTSEIIDNRFLEKEFNENQIILGGNGSFKFQTISTNKNLLYVNPLLLSQPAIILANRAFIKGDFANVAYSEPFYIKPVYFRK